MSQKPSTFVCALPFSLCVRCLIVFAAGCGVDHRPDPCSSVWPSARKRRQWPRAKPRNSTPHRSTTRRSPGQPQWERSVPAGSLVEPIKLLPNEHFLITFTVSTAGLASSSVLREVDLAGTVIWQMTSTDLNSNFSSVSKLSKGPGLVEPHPLSL
jgi:hypothetical protein